MIHVAIADNKRSMIESLTVVQCQDILKKNLSILILPIVIFVNTSGAGLLYPHRWNKILNKAAIAPLLMLQMSIDDSYHEISLFSDISRYTFVSNTKKSNNLFYRVTK